MYHEKEYNSLIILYRYRSPLAVKQQMGVDGILLVMKSTEVRSSSRFSILSKYSAKIDILTGGEVLGIWFL